MKAVVQRVRSAEVRVDGEVVGRIDRGLLVYVGVGCDDSADDAERLAEKVVNLRIFEDDAEKLNLNVRDVRGGVLAIPNFTLMADARKGRRPSFVGAAAPEDAGPVFGAFVAALKRGGCPVAVGAFGATMLIRSDAEGPVNILLEMPPPGGEP